MEQLKTTGKFEEIKPKDGMKLAEYLKTVKQMNTPEQYYVPYNVKYAENAKINYYVENKVNYLVIEYEVPREDESLEAEQVKLIIAKHPNTIVDPEKTKNTLKMFLNNSQMYSTAEAIDSITYIAKLQKMGWEFTNEGIDLMQVTKLQENVELKRTQFTEAELEEFSRNNQIEENRRKHIDKTEKEIIADIKQYILSTYEELPNNISQEIDIYKEKIQRYISLKEGEKEGNLLEAMFKELKPITETTKIIPLMQKSYNQNIEGYLDMIPTVYRARALHSNFKEYMRIREIAVKEKEENNKELPENSVAEAKLETLVTRIDNEKDEITANRIEIVQDKVNKKLKANENKEIEIA